MLSEIDRAVSRLGNAFPVAIQVQFPLIVFRDARVVIAHRKHDLSAASFFRTRSSTSSSVISRMISLPFCQS